MEQKLASEFKPKNKLRFITAASLFDGHDAAINIMRRILQACGVEVIHLAHNRSVAEIVTAAIQEDVHAIAISSYQGGHVEFFQYTMDLLKQYNASHIKVFGGGGGVITSKEIALLCNYGVTAIYTPEDGQRIGLKGIVQDMMAKADVDLCAVLPQELPAPVTYSYNNLARLISAIETKVITNNLLQQINAQAQLIGNIPVLGITGTGGAGKSSLTDEIIRRFRNDEPDISLAVIALDPTKRKTGGALLGDRIRMNAIVDSNIYMRSLAMRDVQGDVIQDLSTIVNLCKCAGFKLIIIETPGIGQGDSGIVSYVNTSLYVMTPEYGATSQLEKIDMLDFADFVVINKFDRRGSMDAIRDVRKQLQRNHELFDHSLEDMPVYGTVASHFNDSGVTALYQGLLQYFNNHGFGQWHTSSTPIPSKLTESKAFIIPSERVRYLAEIVETVQTYQQEVKQQLIIAREVQQLRATVLMLGEKSSLLSDIETLIAERELQLTQENKTLLDSWPQLQRKYSAEDYIFHVRDREIRTRLHHASLSGLKIPKVVLPKFVDDGDKLLWLSMENVPGSFPYTAGVYPFKREHEDPGRMFAGEGDPFRTNRRFKLLSEHSEAKRLSTAFDSVTLYGFDPDKRPDIYGKVGNSGVSIATLEDMKTLYDDFDLTHPATSVSMTINGPAPTILAMFLNTAIDFKIKQAEQEQGGQLSVEERSKLTAWTLANVRGTVQADILKEDQGQNTCIFSTEFSLKMMADIQEYFVQHKIRNFYSVSISGYHIAEARSRRRPGP